MKGTKIKLVGVIALSIILSLLTMSVPVLWDNSGSTPIRNAPPPPLGLIILVTIWAIAWGYWMFEKESNQEMSKQAKLKIKK